MQLLNKDGLCGKLYKGEGRGVAFRIINVQCPVINVQSCIMRDCISWFTSYILEGFNTPAVQCEPPFTQFIVYEFSPPLWSIDASKTHGNLQSPHYGTWKLI